MSRPAALPRASERLEAALGRLNDPSLQTDLVFEQVFVEEARRAAREADERAASGNLVGPLDGRLVSVKGLFDIAGEVTSAGSKVLRGQAAATADAAAVTLLREAGAVIVGRTTMTEFAFSAVGVNPHQGDPGNPHDRSRITGGSSSGAAVSVATGIVDIALGSDTGGSIRIPAALCGVVGLKPSAGAIPTSGAFPLSPTLDTVGTLARSVAQCAAADSVLRGTGFRPATNPSLANICFTIPRGRLFSEAEAAVSDAFEVSISRMRAAGCLVQDGSFERELDRLAALDRIGVFTAPELAVTLAACGITDLADVDPRTRARIEGGRSVSAENLCRMAQTRASLIAEVDDRLSGGEILILPTVPLQATSIAAVVLEQEFHRINALLLRNTRIANLMDLPSISLPLPGTALPVGLMLIGRRGSDLQLIAVARLVEAILQQA